MPVIRTLLALALSAFPLLATTSYANTGGTGDRRSLINIDGTMIGSMSGHENVLINGSVDNSLFFNGGTVTGKTLIFDFSPSLGPVVIDEAKWYQDNATAQGTWKWQGSNDAITWTDIGSSFTLGGATPFQTITALNGNTTAYVFYQLINVSGSTSNSPWTQEIEFKIGTVSNAGTTASTSYANSGGTGNRAGVVSVSFTGLSESGSPSVLLDGNTANNTLTLGGVVVSSSKHFDFDFSSIGSVVIDQVKWYQGSISTNEPFGLQGYWKWQGSNDNSTFTDIGWALSLGGGSGATQTQGAMVNNSAAYKYYRLVGLSGNTNNLPKQQEVEFRVSGAVSLSTGGYAVVM